MAYNIDSPNTGTTLVAGAPDAQRTLWEKGAKLFEQTTDFFRPFEGMAAFYPIQSKTDLSKGRGQKITFTTMAGLYGRAHIGEELFENGDHFEQIRLGTNDLEVDWFRHGVRFTERGEEVLGMRGELEVGLPEALGAWLGRLKTRHMFHQFLKKGDAAMNYRFINNRSSANALLPEDTLSHDAIVQAGAQMQRANGRPAYVGTDQGKNPIHKYVVVSTSDALFSLDMDPDYKAAKIDAGLRGAENLFFKGGYANLRGHVIKEYTAIDHDGAGPVGSPINPKAELGVAIASGTAAVAITGGGYSEVASLSRVDYFEDFPNFAFRFAPGDIVTPSGDDFYVAIVNQSGADTGKFGFYKCSTNNGLTLTMTERLAATTGGGGADITKDQVGNVVWDADKNTVAHPEGSLVILCSENGAPIGYTLFMGAAASRRGYGKYQRRRVTDDHEGGFVRDVFIQSVFGQAPRRDVRGRAPGFLVLAHAINYPGITLDPTLAE